MKLLLVQHGEAVSKDQDPDRPLTDRGRADVAALAALLERAGQLPDAVWHSGKTRARQSAELLTATGTLDARDGLGPNDDPAAFAQSLADEARDRAIVGHQPFLGKLASHLLVGSADALHLGFEPGSAAELGRRDDGGWALTGFVRPALLRPE